MAFMDFQVERFVTLKLGKTPVLAVALVTFQDVAHQKIEQDVNSGGCEQDSERCEDPLVIPSDATGGETNGNDRYAKALREIFADE